MKEIIIQVNSLPLIAKLLLCIPCIDIFYSICRAIQGYNKGNTLWLILGILTIFPGAFFMWIFDLVWVLLRGHALGLGEEMFS